MDHYNFEGGGGWSWTKLLGKCAFFFLFTSICARVWLFVCLFVYLFVLFVTYFSVVVLSLHVLFCHCFLVQDGITSPTLPQKYNGPYLACIIRTANCKTTKVTCFEWEIAWVHVHVYWGLGEFALKLLWNVTTLCPHTLRFYVVLKPEGLVWVLIWFTFSDVKNVKFEFTRDKFIEK